MSGIDYGPMVDLMARTYYEHYDSHFPDLSWEQYKAEDASAAKALYIDPQNVALLRAKHLFEQAIVDACKRAEREGRSAERQALREAFAVAARVMALAGYDA